MPKNHEKLSVGFLFDDTLDSNDGVAQYVKRLGSWLSDEGHDVSYLVGETKLTSWHGGKVYSLAKNLKISWGGNRLSMPLFSKKSAVKSVLDANNYDILHVTIPYSPFMAQRAIRMASPTTAIVGAFHIYPSGPIAKFGSRILHLILLPSLRRISIFSSVSKAAAAYAQDCFKTESTVVPNPVDVSSFSDTTLLIKPKEGYKIVFLGRLVKRKGCQQLIDAFALLADKIPKVSLEIAGGGPLRSKLENRVKELGIEERVKFWGFISEEQKPSFLADADVACFPSLYGEAFGIVLIEAMAAGSRVVLGGNNPGYSSVLENQPKLLIDPKKTELFAQRLHELLIDKMLINKLHTWQQKEVKKYDINRVGNQVLDMYTQAIAKLDKKSHN